MLIMQGNIFYEEEPVTVEDPQNNEEGVTVYESPLFPSSDLTQEYTYVYPLFSDDITQYINDKNEITDLFMNGVTNNFSLVQANLNVINNSVASLHLEISDNAAQIQLLQDQLEELQNINNYLVMFYSLFLLEWLYKHFKSWRIHSTSTGRNI